MVLVPNPNNNNGTPLPKMKLLFTPHELTYEHISSRLETIIDNTAKTVVTAKDGHWSCMVF